MKVYAAILSALVLLSGLADGKVDAMAQCPAERLDTCEPVIASNVWAACDVGPGEAVPSGRQGVEPSKAPLGHFLLKMIRWLSAKKSWLEPHLRDGTANSDSLKDLKSAATLGYFPVPIISILLAIILILFSIIFVLPLLWCRCTRQAWFPKAAERPRSKRSVVIVCFAVLLVLACLFYYGAMWYSFWTNNDITATPCTVAGLTHQTLYEDQNSTDNGRFKGINNLLSDVESSSNTVTKYSSESGLKTLTGSDFVLRSLVAAFSPLLWTSQMLNQREFQGWPGTTEQQTVADTFKLNLVSAAHPQWATPPTSDEDPDQFTLAWVEAYGPLMKALTAVESLKTAPFADGGEAGTALSSADEQMSSFSGDLNSWSKSIIKRYNDSVKYMKDVDPKKPAVQAGIIGVIVISAVTFLGILAGTVIFVHYVRTDQHIDPVKRPGHKMTRFAGFMSCGYIFWAIILFILGGILMVVAYLPSEGCHILGMEVVEDGNWDDYTKTIAVNSDLVDACLKPDGDGDLFTRKVKQTDVDSMTNFKISGLEDLTVPIKELDLTKLKAFVSSNDWEAMTYIFGDVTAEPLNGPGIPSDPKLRAAVPLAKGVVCDDSAPASVQAVCKVGGMAAISAATDGGSVEAIDIQGLDDLSAIVIDKFLKNMPDAPISFCYKQPCAGDAALVSVTTVPNRSGAEWTKELAWLYVSPDAKLQAASDYVIGQAGASTTVISDWFETLRHLVRLNMLNDKFYRSSKGEVPETITWSNFVPTFPKGISDPCPIGDACPIFYSLADQSDITKGYQLVDYDTWRQNVKADTQAAIEQLSTVDQILTYVKKQATAQTSVDSVWSEYHNVSDKYNCRVLRSMAQKVRLRLCENIFADLASVAIFWFLLALCHIFAFVMAFMYWLARKRERETAAESDKETPPSPPPKGYRHTRGDFLQAAEHGDYLVVKQCAEDYPADTVFDPDYHNSPLHLAAYYGHIDCVRELLARGWSPNELNFHHYTPTSACVTNHNLPFETKSVVVTDLVNAGGNLDIFDHYGNTSLMIATRANERDLVELLLKLGANPDREDDYNADSLQLAQSFGHSELYGLLTEASPRRSGLSPR